MRTVSKPPDPARASVSGSVIHFCGRMFAFDPQIIADLSPRIDAVLQTNEVGAGFGSLACGADILIAEALLARGAELHLVLPFAPEAFLTTSVGIGGEDWTPRYRSCLEKADTVEDLGFDPSMADDMIPGPYRMTSTRAIVRALSFARKVKATPVQIAVHDGLPSERLVGTMADMREWQGLGHRTELICVAPEVRLFS